MTYLFVNLPRHEMKLFNSWRIQIPNHVDIVQRILFDGLSAIRQKRSSEGRWKLGMLALLLIKKKSC
jgi:hypothetical protein